MKKLQKSLKAVHRDLNALAKTVNRLIVAVEKIDKATSLKKTAAKAAAVKKTAPKRVKKVTAADTVLGYIKRSKKGIDTATLMKRPGSIRKKSTTLFSSLKTRVTLKVRLRGFT